MKNERFTRDDLRPKPRPPGIEPLEQHERIPWMLCITAFLVTVFALVAVGYVVGQAYQETAASNAAMPIYRQ